MVVTEADVRDAWSELERRVKAIKNAGGISDYEIANGERELPAGYHRDHSTCYWLPPNVYVI